jgi:hypothetical protein
MQRLPVALDKRAELPFLERICDVDCAVTTPSKPVQTGMCRCTCVHQFDVESRKKCGLAAFYLSFWVCWCCLVRGNGTSQFNYLLKIWKRRPLKKRLKNCESLCKFGLLRSEIAPISVSLFVTAMARRQAPLDSQGLLSD